MESEQSDKKKPMTDEERLALAEKLDKELDEFINSLPRRKYEDGWPEDKWQEEIEKHPFFMTKPPEPGAELHPLYEGLQKLKYDPEENEPNDLALAYKDDGNFNFKHKKYRLAILAYTEGIKVKCGDADIESSLLNNRAAAHFFLKNYRSSLRDCELALKLKPDYDKVIHRAANCCYQMGHFEKAIEYCDTLLDKQKDNKEILELRKTCVLGAKTKQRDERKKNFKDRKKVTEETNLIEEIVNRGIRIEGGEISLERLESRIPALDRVYLDENNNLVWPVVFVIPEYKIVEYVKEFNELCQFILMLEHVFEESAEWDIDRKYVPNRINVYFESDKCKLKKVNVEKTLKDILRMEGYIVKGGTPSFMLLVSDSPAEKRFLENY